MQADLPLSTLHSPQCRRSYYGEPAIGTVNRDVTKTPVKVQTRCDDRPSGDKFLPTYQSDVDRILAFLLVG